jgi:uncharacterized glyoxalase superfamily protein PhnB
VHRSGTCVVVAFASLLLAAPLEAQSPAATCKEGKPVKILRNTPIEIVEAIEPLLPFWTERLGFTKTVEVPHGDRLGFVILVRDGHQVMLQTRASMGDDIAVMAPLLEKRTIAQYIDVDSLDALLACLGDWKQLLPPRTTFYGAREVAVQDPAGFLLVFAEHKPEKQ